MIKHLLLLLLIYVSSLAAEKSNHELDQYYLKEWSNIKPYQIRNAYKLFNYAAKDDLSWTAVAISFKESQLGRWQISANTSKYGNSIDSYDCGIFHNNTKTVLDREDSIANYYNHKEACTDLILDFTYSYANFVAEIKFWQKVHGQEAWSKIWGSYNGGYSINKKYSREIASIIRVLKQVLDVKQLHKHKKQKITLD